MKQAAYESLLYGRFAAVYMLVMFSFGIAKIATRLLPKTHPSRVYASGRLTEGKDRLATALHPKVTN